MTVVDRIVEVSESGRAVKNSPALFALALAAAEGDLKTRRAAFAALPRVARTASHLMEFVSYLDGMRGWGRLARDGVARWYVGKEPDKLAYQMVKYRNRNGWTHADILRMAHPKPASPEMDALFKWAARGEIVENAPRLVHVLAQANAATSAKEIVSLIRDHGLTWEMIPSRWLKEPDVWRALLHRMPLTAMIRNLGRMTAIGAIEPFSEEATFVMSAITDASRIRKARVHPVNVLIALKTYASGRGGRGSLHWSPIHKIVDALDSAFYIAFGNIRGDDSRLLIAVDASGSMFSGLCTGAPLTAAEAAVAMAMITLHAYPNSHVIAYDTQVKNLPISPRQRLDDALRALPRNPRGTDNAQPVLYAMTRKMNVDGFVLFTDDQTWAGDQHPHEALANYRRRFNRRAIFADVNMTSNSRTVAEPDDGLSMTFVGFDTSTPEALRAFLNM